MYDGSLIKFLLEVAFKEKGLLLASDRHRLPNGFFLKLSLPLTLNFKAEPCNTFLLQFYDRILKPGHFDKANIIICVKKDYL